MKVLRMRGSLSYSDMDPFPLFPRCPEWSLIVLNERIYMYSKSGLGHLMPSLGSA